VRERTLERRPLLEQGEHLIERKAMPRTPGRLDSEREIALLP
jgi:hypothetical protein